MGSQVLDFKVQGEGGGVLVQGFRVSGIQGFRVSGFQGFRVSGFQGFGLFRFQGLGSRV